MDESLKNEPEPKKEPITKQQNEPNKLQKEPSKPQKDKIMELQNKPSKLQKESITELQNEPGQKDKPKDWSHLSSKRKKIELKIKPETAAADEPKVMHYASSRCNKLELINKPIGGMKNEPKIKPKFTGEPSKLNKSMCMQKGTENTCEKISKKDCILFDSKEQVCIIEKVNKCLDKRGSLPGRSGTLTKVEEVNNLKLTKHHFKNAWRTEKSCAETGQPEIKQKTNQRR
eukprot:13916275-Ditylum_brightwellii.AAC.1